MLANSSRDSSAATAATMTRARSLTGEAGSPRPRRAAQRIQAPGTLRGASRHAPAARPTRASNQSNEPPPPPPPPPDPPLLLLGRVVLENVPATPPIVSVVVTVELADAALEWRTHTACPFAIEPAPEVKLDVQPIEYSPATTEIGAAALMPVTVTAFEVTCVESSTEDWLVNWNGSGVVSLIAGTAMVTTPEAEE